MTTYSETDDNGSTLEIVVRVKSKKGYITLNDEEFHLSKESLELLIKAGLKAKLVVE